MTKTMALLLFGSMGLLAAAPPAGAWPIPPVTLWSLVEQSEQVVIARVARVTRLEVRGANFDSPIATLEILESLKGDAGRILEVPYPGDLICPAPPVFRGTETVLAFLGKGEQGQPQVVGLSYGTLYPRDAAALEDFRVMVRAAFRLQAARLSAAELAEKQLDWMVEAAARPGTRWHGLYALDPAADRIHSAYDSRTERPPAGHLAPRHKARLALAFLTSKVADSTVPMLLQILAGHPDPRVDAAAMEWIEGLLAADEPPWIAKDLIVILLHRFGDADPEKRLLDEKGEMDWTIEPERLRAIWAAAKAELELPTLAPRAYETERFPVPVGADTPL